MELTKQYSFSLETTLAWILVVTLVLENVFLPVVSSEKVVTFPLGIVHARSKTTRHRRDTVSNQRKNLQGKPGQGYYLQMDIGTPPQRLNVLIDTGSSNFAVAATSDPNIDRYFFRENSSSYHEIGTSVYVPYTQGDWQGILGTDLVALTSLPNITVSANIAFITQSKNFYINGSDWEGILGLAYREIARPDDSVTPFFHSLVDESGLKNIFSIQLCGIIFKEKIETDIEIGGSITFGGIDSVLHTGPVYYTAIHKEWYYEVVIVDIEVDGKSVQLDCKEYNFPKTIVDSGTTNLRLPVKVFEKVIGQIKAYLKSSTLSPSAGFWTGDTDLCFPQGNIPYNDFPNIALEFAENTQHTFKTVIASQQYIRPVGEELTNKKDEDCYKLGISSSTSGTVIGAVVMEGFYVIFDRENKRIGFSNTSCPARSPNSNISHISGPYVLKESVSDCAYAKPDKNNKTITIVAYVLAGICGACILPLFIVLIQYQCRTSKCYSKLNRQDSIGDSNDLIEDPGK